MSNIIFARTRTPYDSYQDFFRLVELSEFPLIYVDEIPREGVRDNVYIITPANGEWQHGIETDAKVIHWQLEWCTHPNDSPNSPPGTTETWSHDAWQARNIGARYVPIGSHPNLVHAPLNGPQVLEYDVALLSYMSYRRQVVAHEMETRGMRLAPNGWAAERHYILTRSKALVHIHQHDAIPGVAALRLALAAAYKMPVITETCADYGIFGQGDLLRADYGWLAEAAQQWVCRNDAKMLEEYGQSLHHTLCEVHTFRKCIEAAL